MVTLEWLYVALLGIGVISIYFIFDKIFTIKYISARLNQSYFRFNLCGLIILDSIFQFLPFKSAIALATFLLRSWLQLLLLYFLMNRATRLANALIPNTSKYIKY